MGPSRIREVWWRTLFATVVAATSVGAGAQPLPQVSVGRIERLADFPSRHVDARHVDVWLPSDYSPARRYQVLYMHDGQMLFDAATTWNKQAWDVHLAVDRLVREGRMAPTLIVGVWNNGKFRHSEYYPEKFLPHLEPALRAEFIAKALQGRPRADAYLRFLVEELKPAIDARYPTLPEPASTWIMGSSMGALISIYALNEYPQVFGAAAGLSVHWVGTGQANAALPLAAFNYLQSRLLPPQGRRLYMDRGTTELDALYGPYQSFVDEIVRDRGWGPAQVMSRVFEGTGHNERAWAARLAVPLQFLGGR
jgi:enterochelin esterase-like enzyme